MLRRLCLFAAVALLGACGAAREDLPREVAAMGDFRMGFNIIVANDVTKGPTSRDATEEELTAAVRAAVEDRLGRYDGDGLYHIGARIEAYVLARAGVPVLYAPQSVMLIALNVYDDATQEKLTEEPVRITALQGAPLVSSGMLNSREEQLEKLAFTAAEEIETFLREHEDTWFAPKDGRERIEFTRDPLTGQAAQVLDEDGETPTEAEAG